jgi:hypothetical protein
MLRKPVVFFESGGYGVSVATPNYDVMPDGRFILLRPRPGAPNPRLGRPVDFELLALDEQQRLPHAQRRQPPLRVGGTQRRSDPG